MGGVGETVRPRSPLALAAFVARPADEPLRRSVTAVLEGLLDEPVFTQACVLERAAVASPATRRFLREFSDGQIDAFEPIPGEDGTKLTPYGPQGPDSAE